MNNTVSKKINSTLKFVYSDNNSLSVIFHDNDLLMGVVGEFNENLKELEKITNTNLYSRGNSILIKSTPEQNEITKNAIQFLANQFINSYSFIFSPRPGTVAADLKLVDHKKSKQRLEIIQEKLSLIHI